MPARYTRKEVQVIIDNAVCHGCAGDINNFGQWHAQEHKQAEHSFFVMNGTGYFGKYFGIQGKGREDDNGSWRQFIGEYFFVLRNKIMLQFPEYSYSLLQNRVKEMHYFGYRFSGDG